MLTVDGKVLDLSEAELVSTIERQLESGAPPISEGSQGSIHLLELAGRRCVVKLPSGGGLRRKIRLAMLRKEHRVYRHLGEMKGIPECYGLVAGRYLVLEHVDGESLRRVQPQEHALFFRRMLETIKELHRRDVGHGDLKKKENILVGPDDEPYLIDFGMAVIRRPGRPLNELRFRLVRNLDFNAWVKRKYGGYPSDISEEDRQYLHPTWLERFGRRIGWPWHPLTATIRGNSQPRAGKRRRRNE